MDLIISKECTFFTSKSTAILPSEYVTIHTGLKLVGCLSFQYCLQFNDDIIASGSADSTVRLWSHQGM